MDRWVVPGCRPARGASQGGPRADHPTPASKRFRTHTQDACVRAQRAILVLALGCATASVIAGVATGDGRPSYVTERLAERHGAPDLEPEAEPQQADGDKPVHGHDLADQLTRWADSLEAGIAVEDPGQVLDAIYWPEQLRLLRRAALVLGCDASVERVAAESVDTIDSDEELDLDGLPRRRPLREENLSGLIEFDAYTAGLILPQIIGYAPELDDATLYDVALAIARACRQHDVDPTLVCALIEVESGFDPRAQSPTDDHGLMQLHGRAVYGVRENIEAGVAHLAAAIDAEDGDEIAGLARYNGGPRKPPVSWAYAERVDLLRDGVPR